MKENENLHIARNIHSPSYLLWEDNQSELPVSRTYQRSQKRSQKKHKEDTEPHFITQRIVQALPAGSERGLGQTEVQIYELVVVGEIVDFLSLWEVEVDH